MVSEKNIQNLVNSVFINMTIFFWFQVTGILQSFRNEENEKIIIDIVAGNGVKWIKVNNIVSFFAVFGV